MAVIGKSKYNRQIERARKALQRIWEQIESMRNLLADIVASNRNGMGDEDIEETAHALFFVLDISQKLDTLSRQASELESCINEFWQIGLDSKLDDD